MVTAPRLNVAANLGCVLALALFAMGTSASIAKAQPKHKISVDLPQAKSNLGGMVQVVVTGTMMGPKDKSYDVYITAKEIKEGAARIKIGRVSDLSLGDTGTVKYTNGPEDAPLTVGATYEIEVKMYPAGADPAKTKPVATDKKKWTVALPKGSSC